MTILSYIYADYNVAAQSRLENHADLRFLPFGTSWEGDISAFLASEANPARVQQRLLGSYEQPNRTQPHPIRNYVSDMHPVGTGVGAVVGGLLGSQIGGGNGKKIATVAGVLLCGYAGNEVAHNRNPLPR